MWQQVIDGFVTCTNDQWGGYSATPVSTVGVRTVLGIWNVRSLHLGPETVQPAWFLATLVPSERRSNRFLPHPFHCITIIPSLTS
jgi:hypothetical protein